MMVGRKVQQVIGRSGRARRDSQRLVLFGDSHTYAVQRAIERRTANQIAVPLTPYRLLKIKGDKQVGDTTFEAFLEIVRPLSTDDVAVSMIGGNQHAVFSTIQHPQAFDFLEPGHEPSLDPGTEMIPYQALADVFERGIRGGDGKSLEALRRATSARVVHIIPPPPKADNAFIAQYHETLFAKEGITTLGVSSPSLRLKFWKLQTRMLIDLCQELGIEVMMPPAAALDENGFLLRDYYANDATHANASYGELLLREIESRYVRGKQDA
jgi:hypothetical protein